MNDEFRHFIIDYPSLNLLNSWKQKKSPLQDIEQKGVKTAEGFEAGITEAPSRDWGGLVKTILCPDSFLDGIPGFEHWFYSIGIMCKASQHYLDGGLPAYFGKTNSEEVLTSKVRLWSAIKDYNIYLKCSCQQNLYITVLCTLFSLLIFL
ncbi:hypothetical protein TVAG_394880 [Trichomonas vaginalis G3]|uniref:Uncharacterized protein n=1 Tax=Trichomonas vaginalis (strain ATCC PRA-98 / G3) TaxID=412133 RepID=A2EDF2_TRIV3|nr:hypothetical protein TVAGG3_0725170 [Trichomonas vaginalis G3]EAY09316.1 hypothetical protein TVAG_394880 [Trichomonas vaginalis G3]KAI5510855.1 hypothetical protein TVAGG3_0725170 [Trichomonas vaginalis G3]|eukprot:XP_001321539.1 hypothetical protein [Trichomonas vaginalis G3]